MLCKLLVFLFEEDRPLNESSVLRIRNIDFISEGVSGSEVLEAREDQFESVFIGLPCLGLEVEVHICRGAFSYSLQRITPDQLLAHTDDDGGLTFSHGLRGKGIGNLEDTERADIELVPLQQEREDLLVIALHNNIDSGRFSEWVFEGEHGRSVVAYCSRNWLRFHYGGNQSLPFQAVLPLAHCWVLKHNSP